MPTEMEARSGPSRKREEYFDVACSTCVGERGDDFEAVDLRTRDFRRDAANDVHIQRHIKHSLRPSHRHQM
jgi:hypothetical protein